MDVMKQHDAKVTAEADGESLGIFDTFSPPEAGSETGRYRPGGGQGKAVATRGQITLGTAELSKAIVGRDEYDRYRRLQRRAGRARMIVTEQPLDPDGNPFGKSTIWRGVLSTVQLSDYNADGSDQRTVTLTLQPDDEIG